MNRLALLAALAMLAVGCGTGGTDFELVEPTPTLFPDETRVEPVDTTTSAAPTTGIADFDRRNLPAPRDAAGVVVVDGVAAPVIDEVAGEWTVETPCGASLTGTEPATERALVILDPAGDARTPQGAAVVERNAAVATATAERLDAAGIATVVTRNGAIDLAATYRRGIADAAGALVVVTVSLVDGVGALTSTPGLEVVHPVADDESRRLASLVFDDVSRVIDIFTVEWPDDTEAGVRSVLNQRGDDFFTMLRERSSTVRTVVHLPVDPNANAVVWAGSEDRAPIADALANAVVRWLVTDGSGSAAAGPEQLVRQAPVADGSLACTDPLDRAE